MMKVKYWIVMLLCALMAGACSDGELEGDLYPVSPDKGGSGNNSQIISKLLESMVRVPGGTFLMGSGDPRVEADESPAHLVTLSSFCISRYEVPQVLWAEIMGSNPSVVIRTEKFGPIYTSDLPVTNISYDDCLEFIRKLNERTGKVFALPTEAQWELAARDKYAGVYSDEYLEGNNGPDGSISDVFGYGAPNWELCNMGGNVWEWCADWYGEYSAESQKDPTGPKTGKYRVFRGGSFAVAENKCRATYRASNLSSTKGDDLGFRLVMKGFIDLQVSQEKLNFKRNGGTQTMTVTTEKSWSYDVSAAWCRVSKSGKELTVIVDENRGQNRKTVITITAGNDVMELPVEQDGETFEMLYQGEQIDTLRATYMGGEATLTVRSSSSVGWMVESGDFSWCHVNKSGSSIHITIDPSKDIYNDRETYVLLLSTDELMTDTLRIVQKRVIDLELRLNGDSDPVEYLSAKKAGGSALIVVRTNAYWFTVVSGNDSWCHVVEKTSNSFKIEVDALSGAEKIRQTFVAVDAEGIRDTIWVKQNMLPRVGDYYNKNGIKGIVYEVSGDERSGKIVSLKETTNIWSSRVSTSNGLTGATNQSDGMSNMNIIYNISGWYNDYPAFYVCNQQGDDWYLPARYELRDLFAAVRTYGASKFDQALSGNGGQVFSSASAYWSSTEINSDLAYAMDRQGTEYNTTRKNTNYRVRAIRRVTFD